MSGPSANRTFPLLHVPSRHQSRFGSAHLFVTDTWLRARHSETDPSGCLKKHSFISFLVVCPGRPVTSGLLRWTRTGPAILVLSTRPSMSSCHVMLWGTPLLCLMFALAPPVFRTRPVGFSSGPSGSVSAFRCCASAVRFDSVVVLDIFLDVVYVRRLECLERFPEMDMSIRNWYESSSSWHHCDTVVISETSCFVVLTSSTRRWIAELRDTSSRSPSSDLLWRSRSLGPLHRHRPLSKIFLSVSAGRLWWGQNRDDNIWISWEEAWCGQDQNCRRWVIGSPLVWPLWICPCRVLQCGLIVPWHCFTVCSTKWTVLGELHRNGSWSCPQIQSKHLARRSRLLVIVILLIPVERCRINFSVAVAEDAVMGTVPNMLVF